MQINSTEKKENAGPQSPIMDLQKEAKPSRFVLQEHIRGKSSHLDIRFETNEHLMGFTLDDPGKVGTPLKFRNDAEYSSSHKVLCQLKSRQPKEWLTVKGEIEPGEIGATKNFPAKFKILDSGTCEMGAQKPDLLEVFLSGKTHEGRFVFEKLQRKENNERAGKTQSVWFAWKPLDQTPYVLSSRAINQNFVPPKGKSAMNADWEAKIPTDLKWWRNNWEGAKAIITIKSIRKALLKRKLLSGDKIIQEKKPKKLQHIPLSNEQIGLITKGSLDKELLPRDIANMANCSKESVVYWQKKLGLR